MANTVEFSRLYVLTDNGGGNYTVGSQLTTPGTIVIGDDDDGDPLNDDLAGGNSDGDGTEAATGEHVSYSVENGANPQSATYEGYMINGGMVVSSTSGTYLATDNATAPGPVDATAGVFDYSICFLPGTLVATPQGERPIESFAIGDEITLANGEIRPIKWIGKTTAKLHRFNRKSATPVLIRAGALGGGLPKRDLYTTYDHGFALDGVLAIAGVLVNGTSIVQCSDWPEDEVTYFQLEVEGHELMVVEGIAAETFVDSGMNRTKFDNVDEFHALYPDAVPAEQMALGRVSVRRQLPRAVTQRIARAAKATRVA